MTARRDPIVIVDYDPEWPARFERERPLLERVLAPVLVHPIEHIGSTAVPGLAAKAIIDLCAVVADIDPLDAFADALDAVGWIAAPEPDDVAGRRRSFCTPSVEWRTHHLHVVEAGSTGWRGWLAFRDHLRTHPEDAAEYARLKRSLAADAAAGDPDDRTGYRSGKGGFIQRITRVAVERPPSP